MAVKNGNNQYQNNNGSFIMRSWLVADMVVFAKNLNFIFFCSNAVEEHYL